MEGDGNCLIVLRKWVNMHFADIDKILDRRMVLTMKQDNEIFLASREIEARIPINILEEGDEKYMLINFPSSFGDVQKNRIFLKKYDAKNIGSHYVIRERINHVEKWKYIHEIMNLPSVVVNRINLKGGLIAFYFRYHHSVNNKISNVIQYFLHHISSRKFCSSVHHRKNWENL